MASVNKLYKADAESLESTLGWIRSQLNGKDAAMMDFVVSAFTSENLTEEFYTRALKEKNDFVKRYFAADLRLRNAKVEYLNTALGRKAGSDIIRMDNAPEGDDSAAIAAIFREKDLLQREKAMDDFLWDSIDSINIFKSFKLDNVLGIVCKLCIIRRWMLLDEETGRTMLRKLVEGVRGSYGNIEFDTLK